MRQQHHSPSEVPPTLVGLVRHRARRQPEQTAYTFLADGETEKETLNYRELDRRARAVAAGLQYLGLAGERVLLLYPPGLEYLIAFFGCLYAGAVAVPAYPPRRNRSLDRLQAVAADCGAIAALSTPTVLATVEKLLPGAPGLRRLRWLTGGQAAGDPEAWCEPALDGDALAFLQYTSGSTAAPRGVVLTHGNLLHNLDWIRRRFEHTATSRGVIWLPPYHDMGLIGGILQTVYLGAHCYLLSPVSVFSSPFSWLQAVSRFRATTSGGPNFAYDLCVRKVTPEQRATLDLSRWEVAFTGAEPVRPETLERFAAAFAPCGFRREAFYPCYGLAEATLLVSAGGVDAPPVTLSVEKAALAADRVVPVTPGAAGAQALVGCGQNLEDQRLLIVHPETRVCCRPGQVGEIWVCGPSIAQGYWNRPEESRQTFGAYLADTGEGPFLRTGDLGFVRAGEVFITGRLKDLIIIRGRNLYPQDLERTAEQTHPALQPGCAAAFSVEKDSQERLVLACELSQRQPPDVTAVASAVRRAVAEEHEVDAYAIVLLRPGGMPRTSSGKIQRHACRNAFLAGSLEVVAEWRSDGGPPGDRGGLTRAALLAAPAEQHQPLLEAYFRGQLAHFLRLDLSRVGRHQPVNTLGLDSLTTVELRNALEGGLGVVMPVTRFLQGATIAQLASDVLAQLAGSAGPAAGSPLPVPCASCDATPTTR
jgi:acyl-CoA synthetase (AMP-forming)/AMP-acid ligase II